MLCSLRIFYKVNRVELEGEQGKLTRKRNAVVSGFILAGYTVDSRYLDFAYLEVKIWSLF